MDADERNRRLRSSLKLLSARVRRLPEYDHQAYDLLRQFLHQGKSVPTLLRLVRGAIGFVGVWLVLELLPVITLLLDTAPAPTGFLESAGIKAIIAFVAICMFVWLRPMINQMHERAGADKPLIKRAFDL